MNETLLIVGMMLATMATRIPVLMALSRRELPQGIFRALTYVPPAVLSAIIFPAVLMPESRLIMDWRHPPLLASILAVLVAWRTRNLLLTILVGMGALLLLRTVM